MEQPFAATIGSLAVSAAGMWQVVVQDSSILGNRFKSCPGTVGALLWFWRCPEELLSVVRGEAVYLARLFFTRCAIGATR